MSHQRSIATMLSACLFMMLITGCSSDNPVAPKTNTPYHLVAPLENAIVNLPLTANQPTTFSFTLQLPPDIPLLTAAEIDIAGTLDHVSINGIPLWKLIARKAARLLGGAEDVGATATLRVGSDPQTVCEAGVLYGPFEVSHGTSLVVSPESVTVDESTLQIINLGAMTVCMTITANVDATLSVDAVAMDIAEGNCSSPSNFAGTWNGTYECGDSCNTLFGGNIQLVVTQSGTEASYTDDGGDSFSGVVCGNMFRFEYTGTDFVERGTLTLDGPNIATKRSTWRSTTEPYCGGDCVDYLTREATGNCPPLVITSGAPPAGHVGQPYFYQVTTSGGEEPISRWAIPAETIPGLEFQENGILSGTPLASAIGTWIVDVTVYDACPNEKALVNRTYELTITE